MTSHLIDKTAKALGDIEVKETPVGFKYIGDIMVNNPDSFIIGGEESGGLTIRGHIPEKDGILACLLAAETVAMQKKSLSAVLKDIEKLTGKLISERVNFHLDKEVMEKFRDKLKKSQIDDFAGLKVQKKIDLDGDKFILDDNTWIGFRLSGTEPVVRLYAETDSAAKMKKLLKFGKEFVYGA
jgi:phosphomannomutase